jgi:hypothetical protein
MDLPSLPQYCLPTVEPLICWNSMLGKCSRGSRCKYTCGHLKKGDAIDAFPNDISDVISKEVLYYNTPPLPPDPLANASPQRALRSPDIWDWLLKDAQRRPIAIKVYHHIQHHHNITTNQTQGALWLALKLYRQSSPTRRSWEISILSTDASTCQFQ